MYSPTECVQVAMFNCHTIVDVSSGPTFSYSKVCYFLQSDDVPAVCNDIDAAAIKHLQWSCRAGNRSILYVISYSQINGIIISDALLYKTSKIIDLKFAIFDQRNH